MFKLFLDKLEYSFKEIMIIEEIILKDFCLVNVNKVKCISIWL